MLARLATITAAVLVLFAPLTDATAATALQKADLPDTFETSYRAYQIARQQGNTSTAIDLLDHAVGQAGDLWDSKDPKLLNLRLELLDFAAANSAQTGFLKDPVADLPGLMKEVFGPLSAERRSAAVAAADVLRRTRKWKDGIDAVKDYLRDYKNSKAPSPIDVGDLNVEIAKAYYFRGLGKNGRNYLDNAEDAYSDAPASKDKKALFVANVNFWRAKIAKQRRKKNRALKYINRALKVMDTLAPADAGTLSAHAFALGIHSAKGQLDKAAKHAQLIAKINPGSAAQAGKPIYYQQPDYPDRGLFLGREGSATIEFDVAETGAVINARVVSWEGLEEFGEEALKAVQKFYYVPGYRNGKPRRLQGLQYTINFQLKPN